MDPDIAALVRDERLAEAAALAASRGQAATASELFERACAFGEAARSALEAGDATRAMVLGATARDEQVLAAAFAALVRDPAAAVRAAERLAQRGEHAW